MATRPKRPRDTNQLAKLIVDLSTDRQPVKRKPPKRKPAPKK